MTTMLTDQEGRGGIEMTKVTERIQGIGKEIEQIENEGDLQAHQGELTKLQPITQGATSCTLRQEKAQ